MGLKLPPVVGFNISIAPMPDPIVSVTMLPDGSLTIRVLDGEQAITPKMAEDIGRGLLDVAREARKRRPH